MIGLLKMVYEESYMDYYSYQTLPIYHLYSEDDVRGFYKNNKLKITNEVFQSINFMLRDNILEMPIFKLDIGGQIARISIHRDSIDSLLQECIKNYEETEEYEKCAKAIKLIREQYSDI